MSLLKPILCLFDRHSPIRSTAHRVDESYIGECRYCGRKIRRLSRGNWKSDHAAPPPAETHDPISPPPTSSN